MKSIEAQAAAIALRWPSLELRNLQDRAARWVGSVAVHEREYLLDIAYDVPLAVERFTPSEVQPRVRVLEPALERHASYDLGPLPHVYWTKSGPVLCLFDPAQAEWTPDDLLADTTVPWALRWLVFYEGWLATKRWMGGGRDHDPGTGRQLGKSATQVSGRGHWFASAASMA